MIALERVPLAAVPWAELDRFADRTVFQRRSWLAFLEATHGVEPVVAAVLDRDRPIGWFTGAIVRKLGVRFLGSPIRGWTTSYMGFNLTADVPTDALLPALRRFAFRELYCVHCEVMDRRFAPDAGAALGFHASALGSYEVDLTRPLDKILAGMNQARRHAIRRAPRNGVVVERATGVDFADEHYAQLCDVFAKQALPPPYPVSRLRELIRHVEPAGDLLLVRARDPDGKSIATAIFTGYGQRVHFWMGASYRAGQKLLPNEAIQWFAINHWKARGATAYDMGGGGAYKAKYGGAPIAVGWLRTSLLPGMEQIRAQLLVARKRLRKLRGRLAERG
jgi:hypothetical protein